jgi:fructose-bisphosphate aldolase class II
MVRNLTPLLEEARTKGQAVGSFNVYSYETVRGVLEAGASTGAPVIVAFGERYLAQLDFETVVAMCRAVARVVPADHVIHLDHCKSEDDVYRAMRAGFTSVMFDGSALPFEENLSRTRRVVEVAHALGVSVEAELGSLSAAADSQEGDRDSRQIYTDPGQAALFAGETGVDALAVSIGTVHGSYKGTPKIRVDVLKEIRRSTPVPLVLHGGSGTPPDVLRECIAEGITKINVNTEISASAVQRLRDSLAGQRAPHLSTLSGVVVDSVRGTVEEQIGLFTR